jgi:uncharacterized membrane protein
MQSAADSGGSVLPSPEDLKKYDAASPGLGRIIIEMVQEEQRHLHSIDKDQIAISRRGQLFGFIIAISFLLVAGALVGLGHSVAGTIIGSVDLVSLTTVFVVGRHSQRDSLGASTPQSTDIVIRQLRRANKRSRNPKKPQEKTAQIRTEQSLASQTTEAQPASAEEQKKAQAPPNPGTPVPSRPESAQHAEEHSQTQTVKASPIETPKDPPSMTEEDIRIYKKIHEDPGWRPGKDQRPAS